MTRSSRPIYKLDYSSNALQILREQLTRISGVSGFVLANVQQNFERRYVHFQHIGKLPHHRATLRFRLMPRRRQGVPA
jgi:hypothetical protein